MSNNKRSWSRRALIGGAALSLAGVLVAAVVGFVGYRMAMHTLAAQSADPSTRNARAMELLGATELPAGYQATGSLSLPLVGDIVVLEDRAARFALGSGHAFLYLETRRVDRRLPFGPGNDDPFEPLLELRGFEVERGTSLTQGEIAADGHRLVYEAFRGHMERMPPDIGRVVFSLIEVECEEFRRRRRVAAWIGPDPLPTSPPGEAPLSGTTADPERIRSLFDGFDLCGG